MRVYCDCVPVRFERCSVAVTHNKIEKVKECKKSEDRFVEKPRGNDFCERDFNNCGRVHFCLFVATRTI